MPVATIKFYLREGLLPDGVLTSATQAQYDETHVARLRLVRALIGPGGLSHRRGTVVIEAIDDPPNSVPTTCSGSRRWRSVARAAHHDHSRVHDLMRSLGWQVDEKDCETHAALDGRPARARRRRLRAPGGRLDVYARTHARDRRVRDRGRARPSRRRRRSAMSCSAPC